MRSRGYGTCVTEINAPRLDLSTGVVELAAALIDIPSESLDEGPIADAVARSLRPLAHLEVHRDGNTILAKTNTGASQRVVIGGHLDTVPPHGNVPHHIDGDRLYGLGACDMKGGVAVSLKLAAAVTEPVWDVTYLYYEGEEIDARYNGLARIAQTHPDWLSGDFAILMEPSNADIEAGCQGSLRVEVEVLGERAHSARAWMGDNAIHKANEILNRLSAYQPRVVVVDGLEYREGMNAVGISGGVAGNVIPDRAVVTVNHRYAPSTMPEQALVNVQELFDGFAVTVVDSAPGALPGLSHPAAAAFVKALGATPAPKFGWTDVARFSELGVPAVNYGPGDPSLAHHRDEYVTIDQLHACHDALTRWLTGS